MSDTPQQNGHTPADGTGTAVNGAGSSQDGRVADGENAQTLTTRQGHPLTNNQNLRTVGSRGPATLENYQFLEKISHFDRERVPERVVHARGAGAHGIFEAYGTVGGEPIAKYTRAKLFNTKGKETPVFVRFSTVGHGGHSPETLRDPRGFAVKFYTEDGNWDLVGNNLKVFFIRDAMKFPDLIHSQKPDPVTNRQSGERIFDFICNTPEAMHMVSFLFSPWGIPANYRQMQGSGVNTYKWVNAQGEAVLVKYHWEPLQGIKNLAQADAEAIQAKNFNHATQDLFDHIAKGEFPQWELCVQIMSDDEHPELDFDPLDDTKIWPEDKFPLAARGQDDAEPQPGELLRRNRAVGFRYRRAGRRHRLLRRQDAAGPHLLVLGHPALPRGHQLPAAAHQRAQKARGYQPARRPDGLPRGHGAGPEQPHQLRAQQPEWAEGSPPHGARPHAGVQRPPAAADHRSSRTTSSRPGSATACTRTGSATTSSAT
jgi:hypothetical protein